MENMCEFRAYDRAEFHFVFSAVQNVCSRLFYFFFFGDEMKCLEKGMPADGFYVSLELQRLFNMETNIIFDVK